MTIPYIPDHADRAVGELPSVLRRSKRLVALARAIGAGVQLLEEIAYSTINALWLDTATGPGLDRLASLVGARRGVLSDSELRNIVRGTVRVRRASGTALDVFEVASALFPDAQITLVEQPPARYLVQIQQDPSLIVGAYYREEARRVLDLARPAGWGADYTLSLTSITFGFAPPAPNVGGFGVGAWAQRL
jgi:hypothetical protein